MKLKSLVVLACASAFLSGSVSAQNSQNLKTIAISVSSPTNPFYSSLIQGAKSEAKKLGYDLLVLDAQNKSAKQLADGEDALNRNINALLINGVDDSASTLAKLAKGKGVPVVAVQRRLPGGEDAPLYVGTDNVKIGQATIEWLAAKTNGAAQIVILSGTPGSASSDDRLKGIDQALAKFPSIKVLSKQSGYYDRGKALIAAENLLTRFSKLDAIVCLNDEMAMGALAAAKAQSRKLLITGIDANKDAVEAVKRGELAMTVALSPETIGAQAIRSVVQIKTAANKKAADVVTSIQFIDSSHAL